MERSRTTVSNLNATIEFIASDAADGVAAAVESSAARSIQWADDIRRVGDEMASSGALPLSASSPKVLCISLQKLIVRIHGGKTRNSAGANRFGAF